MTFGLSAASKYELKKKREAERQRKQSAAGRDIGDLPPIGNLELKEACRYDLAKFCKEYLPGLFPLEWSKAHRVAIAKMEAAVLKGGLFALAMPRASGKTTLARAAALWAVLYGHHRYVLVIGSSNKEARKTLSAIKTILTSNEALARDFPEACYPVQKLGGVNQRAPGQLHKGKPTELSWKGDYIQLATIEGADCSGGIIDCAGIEGAIRGRNVQMRDGTSVRPSLVIPDDPQTKKSARSAIQTEFRIEVLNADVLGLVGPGEALAVIMPCTIIEPGDLAAHFLDSKEMPAWQGETTSMLVSLPTNEEAVAAYREHWAVAIVTKAGAAALNSYWLAHPEIGEGALASWEARFEPDELDAIQHALHTRFRVGEKAWFSEYQNQPIGNNVSTSVCPRETILTKLNGLPQHVVPTAATIITGFIDVQLSGLYYVLIAFEPNWTAACIDYGTWPEQPTINFTLETLSRTIQRQFPGVDDKAAIRMALEALTTKLFSRRYVREDGIELPLSLVPNDSGWGQHAKTVYDFCKSSQYKAHLHPSKGKGIGPAQKPLSEYRREPGDQIGEAWLLAKLESSPGQRLLTIDTNYWKTKVHRALLAPMGAVGCLSFWGKDAMRHEQIADHLTSEAPIETFGQGRRIDVWKTLARGDNHFFDGVVGAYAAAAVKGVGNILANPSEKPRSAQRRMAGF